MYEPFLLHYFSIFSPLWDGKNEEDSNFYLFEICESDNYYVYDKISLKFYFRQEISRMKHVKDANSEKNIHRRNRIRKWMRKSANISKNTSSITGPAPQADKKMTNIEGIKNLLLLLL